MTAASLPPIGRHVGTRGSYFHAAKIASAIGCAAFQYFPQNPRTLSAKAIDCADAERCRLHAVEHGLVSIGHTAYPVNLASDDPELLSAMIATVRRDLAIAEACGSIGVVVHFGKVKTDDPLAGYRRVIAALDRLLEQWSGQAKVLLENQAGEGGVMGTTFEELVQIRSLTKHPERIGYCLDTCHLFASGEWDGRNWPELSMRANRLDFYSALAVVHLNDSRYPSGRRKDRHQAVGMGEIGEEAMRMFAGDPALAGIPLIMETPLPPALSAADDIQRVRRLLS